MKVILVLLIIFSFKASALAQPSEVDHQRYWYYRHRLISDFMVPGVVDNFVCSRHYGYSIPASEVGSEDYAISWGDATCDIGDYIAVLATEYRLLKNNNQPVDNTLRELYFAMKAYERVDRTAESLMYPYNYFNNCPDGNLNGFYIRDDVGQSLFDENIEFAKKHTRDGSLSFNSTGLNSEYNGVSFASYPSPDQMSHLYMGFALVNKCLDDNENYNGYNFKNFAKLYTKLMVTWINNNNWIGILPNGEPYNGWSWTMYLEGNQWGIAKAAESICGELHTDKIGLVNEIVAAWNNKGDVFCPNDPNRLDGYNSVGTNLMDMFIDEGNDFATAYMQLYAAIGSSWNYGMEPTCITIPVLVPDICYEEVLGVRIPYPCMRTDNVYCCSYNLNLPANILDNINPGLLGCLPEPLSLDINVTGWALDVHGKNYRQEYYALLHNYLHGESNNIGYDAFASILTSAPCDLPHYKPYSDPDSNKLKNDEGIPGWWTSTRWTRPSKAFHEVPEDNWDKCIFNGLDYMYFYNLFCLVYGTPVPYKDQMNKNFSQSITTTNNINAFNDITLSGIISPPTGNHMDITAGKLIDIAPGGHITYGSDVTLNILLKNACETDVNGLKSAPVERPKVEPFEQRMANQFNAYLPKIDSIKKAHAYQPLSEYVQNRLDTVTSNRFLQKKNFAPEKKKVSFVQLYPVPVTDNLILILNMPHAGQVKISVVDFCGRLVRKWDTSLTTGYNKYTIDASQLANGVYNCLIETSYFCETHKITITK
jgi:hypothetical protein